VHFSRDAMMTTVDWLECCITDVRRWMTNCNKNPNITKLHILRLPLPYPFLGRIENIKIPFRHCVSFIHSKFNNSWQNATDIKTAVETVVDNLNSCRQLVGLLPQNRLRWHGQIRMRFLLVNDMELVQRSFCNPYLSTPDVFLILFSGLLCFVELH